MSEMDYQQKAEALQGLGRLTVGFRGIDDWYCSVDRAEIKRGGMLEGRYGNGATPAAAINDCWRAVTELAPGEAVILDAYGKTRMLVRWNGYMWKPVNEELKR